ncbi:DUF4124 domain-containing protein [Thiobacillus sedimenti]|uniref:DUF4124 domain-containing protein n=1 Tax=Thiobacillus sedimenti TaxID=3110231 RepID=A0ABZ1CHA0_9PROT|nr:DUF4124 domain-containing protein [Thiobacillus sp. SCUT-2]WRS38759.1 DUF4124 domain-containing protein [Thiobacillus sp. SCUT-2]
MSRARALLLVAFAWQAGHAAPLYKWLDGSGHVTYSSLPPPPGTVAKEMRVPPPPRAEDARQAAEQAKKADALVRELEARRREQEAEEARLRALRLPPAPVVIEKPVYVPQPVYYPPVRVRPHPRHPDKPPVRRPR